MNDSVHESSADAQRQSGKQRADKFYTRARGSHAEARKLLTGLAVASFGVLYTTLTSRDAPSLTPHGKTAAILAIFAMGLSTAFGLIAWRADARWAHEAAKKFLVFPGDATGVKPDGGPWHEVKKYCDILQIMLFAIGLIAAGYLTLSRIW